MVIIAAVFAVCVVLVAVYLFIKNKKATTNLLMRSNFGSDKKTGWVSYMVPNVEYLSEDNVNFARIKSSKSRAFASVISPVFSLEPGIEYELSFYLRIPKESSPHVMNDFYFSPTVALYQPEISESGVGISTIPTGDEKRNNLYSYKAVRREAFSATWKIEGAKPYTAKGTSLLSKKEMYEIFGDKANINLALSNWKKVTVKFSLMKALHRAIKKLMKSNQFLTAMQRL